MWRPPAFLPYAALGVAARLLSLRFVERPARRAIRQRLGPGMRASAPQARAIA